MSGSMTGLADKIPEFSFSLTEIFALLGLIQSVAVIVYILFRAGHIRHVFVPVLCFTVLGGGFLFDFGAGRVGQNFPFYSFLQNGLWLALPSFSVLLMIQVADLGVFPKLRYWGSLVIPLFAVITGWVSGPLIDGSGGDVPACSMWAYCVLDTRLQAVFVLGMLSGLLCLLFLWLSRRSFGPLLREKDSGPERYWLILSFVAMDLLLIALTLLYLSDVVLWPVYLLARNVAGGGMAYLASTSLFRIYPPSVKLEKLGHDAVFFQEHGEVIEKINKLLDLDKVYQEPSFSRTDLSRELDLPEAKVSKIINGCFGKTVPQIINERRVKDSLQLLKQTDAQISVVAEQVGFNSLPTFNRVFKDMMGVSPSEYRQNRKYSHFS